MAITRVLYSALGCAASALLISGGNLLELRRLLQGPQKVPRTIELLVRDTNGTSRSCNLCCQLEIDKKASLAKMLGV